LDLLVGVKSTGEAVIQGFIGELTRNLRRMLQKAARLVIAGSVHEKMNKTQPERSLRLCLLRKIRSIPAVFKVCYEMRKRCMKIYPNKRLITKKRPAGEKVKPSEKKNYTGTIPPHTQHAQHTHKSQSREKRLVKGNKWNENWVNAFRNVHAIVAITGLLLKN
jgi:hypothetical protein